MKEGSCHDSVRDLSAFCKFLVTVYTLYTTTALSLSSIAKPNGTRVLGLAITAVGVEKPHQRNITLISSMATLQLSFRSPHLSSGFPHGSSRLAEEPYQSLQVLGPCGKEELLTNELHPA